MNLLGSCSSAIAQLHAKITDQDTKLIYIVQSIAELNEKFDKLFNYLSQSTPTGPFISSQPSLSPPPLTHAVPFQTQTPVPPASELRPTSVQIPETRTPSSDLLWSKPLHTPPLPVRRNSFLKIVENLQDLDNLEQLLGNDLQFRQDVVSSINNSSTLTLSLRIWTSALFQITQMTSVHWSRTNTPGRSIALSIVDNFFDRKFLTTCSWTGSGHGTNKITFRRYQSIIGVFHEIIRFSDLSFTIEETERFFKSVLKNAVKRTAAKLMRKSTKRLRKLVTSRSNGIGNENNCSSMHDNYHEILGVMDEREIDDTIRIKIE